jgi:hypothetical protein
MPKGQNQDLHVPISVVLNRNHSGATANVVPDAILTKTTARIFPVVISEHHRRAQRVAGREEWEIGAAE